jgi:hypothetical protein
MSAIKLSSVRFWRSTLAIPYEREGYGEKTIPDRGDFLCSINKPEN